MLMEMAEAVGFEPTEPCGSTVFKTAAFNLSATPPRMRAAAAVRVFFPQGELRNKDTI